MKKTTLLLLMVVLIVLAASSTLGCTEVYWDDHWVENATIVGKKLDVKNDQYVVTSDKGTFEVNMPGIFNNNESQNPDYVYDLIVVGKTYDLHVCGYRANWDSWTYPYLYEIRERK